jgi:hypothetical protein
VFDVIPASCALSLTCGRVTIGRRFEGVVGSGGACRGQHGKLALSGRPRGYTSPRLACAELKLV